MPHSNSDSFNTTYRFTGILYFSLILLCVIIFIECSDSTTAGNIKTTQENATDLPLTIIVDLPDLPDGARPLTMRLIEPGTFTMGSETSHGGKRGWPAHEVTITRPCYIGVYEITQAQWEAVSGKPSHSKFCGSHDRPVEKVSWFDCKLWLHRLNKLGNGSFRLPTEAEWEYACRAGSDGPYYFLDDHVTDAMQIGNESDGFMWWSGNSTSSGTNIAGLKQPNPWGLYDMHGNVWEWCADRWIEPYNRGQQTDPIVGDTGLWWMMPLRRRVAKGGAFLSNIDECSSAYRFYEQSIDYHYSMGFRIVMTPEK